MRSKLLLSLRNPGAGSPAADCFQIRADLTKNEAKRGVSKASGHRLVQVGNAWKRQRQRYTDERVRLSRTFGYGSTLEARIPAKMLHEFDWRPD